MKFLLLTIFCLILIQAKSQAQKKNRSYLKIKHCSTEPSKLGLENLSLLDGFHPEFLKNISKKRLKVYDFKEQERNGCAYYEILLENKFYHFYFTPFKTFDTLFLSVNLSKDTLIDLNKLHDGYYTKVEAKDKLFSNIEHGDKISILYNYADCPQYGTYFGVVLQMINDREAIELKERKTKFKEAENQSKISADNLAKLEKKVEELQEGEGLEILLRKNTEFKVFKCQLQNPLKLPLFLKDFRLEFDD